jgi:hypothetical protein
MALSSSTVPSVETATDQRSCSATHACGGNPMRQSTDRILTTHAGSLPRPQSLIALHTARFSGIHVEEAQLDAAIKEASRAALVSSSRPASTSSTTARRRPTTSSIRRWPPAESNASPRPPATRTASSPAPIAASRRRLAPFAGRVGGARPLQPVRGVGAQVLLPSAAARRGMIRLVDFTGRISRYSSRVTPISAAGSRLKMTCCAASGQRPRPGR